MTMKSHENTLMSGQTLIPFNSFLRQNERSPSCGQRWRKKGWIATTNIGGRLYVSHAEIARFHKRAADGEFAKTYPSGFIFDDPSILQLNMTPPAGQEVGVTQPEGDDQP